MNARTTRHDDPKRLGQNPAAVCTLSGDGFDDRIAWIRDAILPHVIETVRIDDGLAFELDDAPSVRGGVDHLIGLERDCCASIVFERTASATPGRLRLEVRGIDPDAALFRSLRPARRETEAQPPARCGSGC
jgi:hypothetical protein